VFLGPPATDLIESHRDEAEHLADTGRTVGETLSMDVRRWSTLLTGLGGLDTPTKLHDLHRIYAKHRSDLPRDALPWNRSTGFDQENCARGNRRSPRELADAEKAFGPKITQRHHAFDLAPIVPHTHHGAVLA
jgi:hypothetical protein